MKFFLKKIIDGNSIKTECLIIKTAPPRKSLHRSTRVWLFTSNSSVQRRVLHIKAGKGSGTRPASREPSPPRRPSGPGAQRSPHRSSRPSPWQRPARPTAASLRIQGRWRGLNRFSAPSATQRPRAAFVLRHSRPWKGRPSASLLTTTAPSLPRTAATCIHGDATRLPRFSRQGDKSRNAEPFPRGI